jgi:hypothetical protein
MNFNNEKQLRHEKEAIAPLVERLYCFFLVNMGSLRTTETLRPVVIGQSFFSNA